MRLAAAAAIVTVCVSGCGSGGGAATAAEATIPQARPQVVEPEAGQQALAAVPQDPVGDVHAHATPLSQVRHELREELVTVSVTNAQYIDPLRNVTFWGRTDQGVDASMPVGAPILAPGTVKILAVIPNWYAGQPLVYFELLDGRYAGHVQYVAEQITSIAQPGT
ncbi:MAG: hypothetical protein ACRDMJ_00830, partial [Solirubrobacteraceae bacterium]